MFERCRVDTVGCADVSQTDATRPSLFQNVKPMPFDHSRNDSVNFFLRHFTRSNQAGTIFPSALICEVLEYAFNSRPGADISRAGWKIALRESHELEEVLEYPVESLDGVEHGFVR
jgi:hypothetical protein